MKSKLQYCFMRLIMRVFEIMGYKLNSFTCSNIDNEWSEIYIYKKNKQK